MPRCFIASVKVTHDTYIIDIQELAIQECLYKKAVSTHSNHDDLHLRETKDALKPSAPIRAHGMTGERTLTQKEVRHYWISENSANDST